MRLTAVFETSREIPFDDSTKFIFLSDAHRGDNSRTDSFAGNEDLFLEALRFYYREGFHYVEVGDGDETWKNKRYADIVSAHPRTFELLHRFNRQNRLHLIFGNHDTRGYRHKHVVKNGIPAEEGLILRHAESRERIFVVHGHQADFKSDGLRVVGKLAVRHFWRRLQLRGFETLLQQANALRRRINPLSTAAPDGGFQQFWISTLSQAKKLCEHRIMSWAEARQQIVICGHTHRPMAAACGGPPYFNTGSCDLPGVLTGLEIQNGAIALVRWTSQPETGAGQAARIKREWMAPPRKLSRLTRALP